jgi:flavin-binding protein dodecin
LFRRAARMLAVEEQPMDHVYKSIELTGSSTGSVDEAIRAAIAKASKTLHNLRWFEVTNVRGNIDNGVVSHFQVTMKVGFTLDE